MFKVIVDVVELIATMFDNCFLFVAFILYFFFCLPLFFCKPPPPMATPSAYGSQPGIESELLQLRQHQILNPLYHNQNSFYFLLLL